MSGLDQGKVSASDEWKSRLFRLELRELIGSPGSVFNHSYTEAIISYVFNPIVLSPLTQTERNKCLIAPLTPTEERGLTRGADEDISVFIDDDGVSGVNTEQVQPDCFLHPGPREETISEAHTDQLICSCCVFCPVCARHVCMCVNPPMFTWRSSEIKVQKQSSGLVYLSTFTWRVAVFTALTPRCDHSTLHPCVCACVCALCHLGPPALADLSSSDIHLTPHYEQSISCSHVTESRKDSDIVLLLLESFVLFAG